MGRSRTPRPLPPAQSERIDRLSAETGGRIFAEKVQGASVIAALTRFCHSRDARQINKALYSFLTGHLSFIAHYGLVPPDGGFRIEYADPDRLCADILAAFSPHRVSSVFADGMTDKEVEEALRQIARRQLGVS